MLPNRDEGIGAKTAPAMHQKLNEHVSECLTRADRCARKAERASDKETSEEYRRLQCSWEDLARSYELAARLLEHSKDNPRRREEIFGASERPSANLH